MVPAGGQLWADGGFCCPGWPPTRLLACSGLREAGDSFPLIGHPPPPPTQCGPCRGSGLGPLYDHERSDGPLRSSLFVWGTHAAAVVGPSRSVALAGDAGGNGWDARLGVLRS